MQLAIFVRLLEFLLVLGFAGLTVGCGGESTAPAVNKEQKDIAKQDVREARKEAKEARKEALGKGGGALKKER